MAGLRQVLNQSAMAQPAQAPMPQVTPEMIQAILASQAQPTMMQPGFGANRFLTGEMGLPMQFGVDVPAFTPFQMQPGDFSSFLAAQSKKNPAPVFNPSTGTYSTSK
jgi:hypothetical protein